MELLTSFINRYRELTLWQSMLWLLFYTFIWVVLSLSAYADQIQLNPDSPYYLVWIDQFGWVFCFAFTLFAGRMSSMVNRTFSIIKNIDKTRFVLFAF